MSASRSLPDAMESSQVAVATITWARSPDEELVLLRSLARLADAGLPVAVADRGASAAFEGALARLPRFTVTRPREPNLVSQIKASIELATRVERPFILYVEPDKGQFFEGRLMAFVRRAPGSPDVGVVLASRSEASFATFPPMQRYTEGVVNRLCADAVGAAGDYSYGPFLMNAALHDHIGSLDARLGWGWRPSTFVAAKRRGLRIAHVVDDFCCPPDQDEESERDRSHRLRQLSENILGLLD